MMNKVSPAEKQREESVMKLACVIYVNRDDPRIFIYKHPKWKWFGVTLNFAHWKSFPILLLTLISAFLPIYLQQLFRNQENFALFLFVYYILWMLACLLYYFHMADSDLKRHPGNQSAR